MARSVAPPIPLHLHGLVEAAALADPERVAVRGGKASLTYRALWLEAMRIGAALQAAGVGPGDRVGIYQTKSPRGVAALLGILAAGAAYVPIDPQAPAERARFILQHCGVRVLFAAGRPLRQMLEAGGPWAETLFAGDDGAIPEETAAAVVRVEKVAAAPLEAELRPVHVTEQTLAYVLYTSGSTGAPKGVAITHGQSLAFVRPATRVFELGPGDVVASHAPFNFDLSIIDLFCTFLAGGEIVLLPEAWLAFPTRIAQLLEEARITVWNSVPSALVQLSQHGGLERRDLSALRLVMFAGEPYPLKHLRRLRALLPHPRLLNVYGQTEANSSTYHEVTALPDDDEAPLPIGRPFPNYDVLVLGDDGRRVTSPGVEGELYVIGGAVAAGYWDDPERTALAFVQHPLEPQRRQIVYRTGDRVCFDEAGDLIFRGRVDFAVKVRGFRVELGEISAVAAAHPGIAEAAAVALPDEEAGHLLALFVVPEAGVPLDERALRATLAARLPRYMIPETIWVRERLPATATGKTDRKALTAEAAEALAARKTSLAEPLPG